MGSPDPVARERKRCANDKIMSVLGDAGLFFICYFLHRVQVYIMRGLFVGEN